MAQCRLCLTDKKLCYSHIIPEFMYKSLYNPENHRFYLITDRPDAPKHYKKGARKYLLCKQCEGKLNVWETYFSQRLADTIQLTDGSNVVSAHGLDYKKFKLFQMSLIWRAGISTHPDFSNINLGPHSEKLRQMNYNENPGEPWEYGCMLLFTPSYADILGRMMMLVEERRYGGHKCYIFLLEGLMWIFFVSNHAENLQQKDMMFISKEGVLPLVIPKTKALKQYVENILQHTVNKKPV